MKCDEAMKRIPALVLDELDIEVCGEVRRHLDGCSGCRGERDRQARAMTAIATLGIETSERRRGAAVVAMVAVRDELVERAIMRRPHRWPLRTVAVAAAALLVFAISYVTLLPDATWHVVSVRGTTSPVLAVNDRVRSGDIVALLQDGAITLECAEGRIELNGVSSVEMRGRGRVLLMDGTVRVEARGDVAILSRWNDRVVVHGGAATVVSDLRALSPSALDRDPEPPNVTGDRLRVRVERGQAVLRGSDGEMKLQAGERARIGGRSSRPTTEE